MSNFDKLKKDVEARGDCIGSLMKGQMWIALKGNFTVDELRSIAANIQRHSKIRQVK